jgi:hypothetical protein
MMMFSRKKIVIMNVAQMRGEKSNEKDSENAFFQSTIREETQKMSNVFLPCFCFFVQLKAKSCERKRKNSLQLPSW